MVTYSQFMDNTKANMILLSEHSQRLVKVQDGQLNGIIPTYDHHMIAVTAW